MYKSEDFLNLPALDMMSKLGGGPVAPLAPGQQRAPNPLPVQSEMLHKPLEQDIPDADKPLPVVPSDQISSQIMKDWGEHQVPSGIPDERAQKIAQFQRGLGDWGASSANQWAGFQNAIKPGLGQASEQAALMEQQKGNAAAAQTLGAPQQQRAEAIQNLQLQDQASERRAKLMQMAAAIQAERDSKDPNSELSKQSRKDEIDRLTLQRGATRNPQFQKALDAQIMALKAGGGTHAQIEAHRKNDVLEPLLKQESAERVSSNSLAATREEKAASLAETKRWHDMEQEAKEEARGKESKAQQAADEKTKSQIAGLNLLKSQYENLLAQHKAGHLDTSAAHLKGNEWRGAVNGLPLLPSIVGKPDPYLQAAKTEMNSSAGTAEFAMTNSGRYNPARWADFQPHFGGEIDKDGSITGKKGAEIPADTPDRLRQKLDGGLDFLKKAIAEKQTLLSPANAGFSGEIKPPQNSAPPPMGNPPAPKYTPGEVQKLKAAAVGNPDPAIRAKAMQKLKEAGF